MRSLAARLGTLLLVTACAAAPPAESAGAGPGQPFRLKVGESVRTVDGTWEIGLEGVSADSRCPKGEQCVWAGDATVRLWLRQAAGPRLWRELHTRPRASQLQDDAGIGLRLLHLAPERVSGQAIAQGDYVVTLTVDPPGARAAAGR